MSARGFERARVAALLQVVKSFHELRGSQVLPVSLLDQDSHVTLSCDLLSDSDWSNENMVKFIEKVSEKFSNFEGV